MKTYYKAVRLDGASFNSPDFHWNTEPEGVTTHPAFHKDNAGGYLSVATVPTDCTGMQWPCRLLEVAPVGRVFTPDAKQLPNKRAGKAFMTVRELDASLVFGPQGTELVAFLALIPTLTRAQWSALVASWVASRVASRDAGWVASWDASWVASRVASRDAGWDAGRVASWDAGRVASRANSGLLVRDLIGTGNFTQNHYDLLTSDWRKVIGPLHADDEDLR